MLDNAAKDIVADDELEQQLSNGLVLQAKQLHQVNQVIKQLYSAIESKDEELVRQNAYNQRLRSLLTPEQAQKYERLRRE